MKGSIMRVSGLIGVFRGWATILLAIMLLSACSMREVPLGPLTLAQLSSTNEIEILEALLRIESSERKDEEQDIIHPGAIEILNRVSQDSGRMTVTRALAVLRTIGSSSEGLRNLITNENVDVVLRVIAAYSLLNEGSGDDITFLISLCEDRHHSLSVRWAVVAAMSVEGHSKHDGSVLVRLAKDTAQEPVIRRLALAILHHFNFNQELPQGAPDVLLAALRSGDGELSLAAAETLRKLTDRPKDTDQAWFTEALTLLSAIAFDATKPDDLRQIALEALTKIDRVPHVRERALQLFRDPLVPEPLRHAAAVVAMQKDLGDTAHAAALVSILCDPDVSQRLRDDSLILLNASDMESVVFRKAIQAALPTMGAMIDKAQGNTHHADNLLEFLQSLATQGLFVDELNQLVPTLEVLARAFTEEQYVIRKKPALELLLVLADHSKASAMFLEDMAKDSSVPDELRVAIVKRLSKTARAALPGDILLRIIHHTTTSDWVRLSAIEAMGRLGTDARPFEQELLALTNNAHSMPIRETALTAVSLIGGNTQEFAQAAAGLLLHFTPSSQGVDARGTNTPPSHQTTAASIIRGMKSHTEIILPQLVAALDDPRFEAKHKILLAEVIASIATHMTDEKAVASIPVLEQALKTMKKQRIVETQAEVVRAINALENQWLKNMLHGTRTFLSENVAITAGLTYLITALFLAVVLVRFAPLRVYQLNTWLTKAPEITLPSFLGGLTLSPHPLFIITLFRHHDRVIEAWIAHVLPRAREEFTKKQAVQLRALHIPMPVELSGVHEEEITPTELRKVTNHKRFFLAVEGEGGAGKSSLAFQLASWAMAASAEERIGAFPMIPILLENELPTPTTEGHSSILKAIQTELMSLTHSQESIPEEFIRVLLVRQRLLVIADRVSELPDSTRQQLMFSVPDLPISAFLLTSRREETWPGTSKTRLRPMSISGNFVAAFLEAYLTRRAVRHLFNDEDFFDVCRGLSALTRGRDMTPLLGRMYAEYVLSRKKASLPASPSVPNTHSVPVADANEPRSIPALICRYVDQVGASVKSPFAPHEVHDILQTIAWECVREDFRPGAAPVEKVLAALGEFAEKKLTFSVEQLGLVQSTGMSRDQVRFAIDPLAEYLAALALIQRCGANESAWTTALKPLDSALRQGGGQAFVQVLVDCCGTEFAKAVPLKARARVEGLANSAVVQSRSIAPAPTAPSDVPQAKGA
ncbi:hypothetical protein [Myxococcus sp. AS-1-15]|uniref:hypothetical protein n=1 Tax=Myxococcus sp. AS-1-15 TaxID=2874600 RepID=UPI001CBC698E|nr:hypothetical protein [Myxococcus sp. AS-1-15]MBZ4397226.1 hypothetical protein [Myxococcus sp. AS-1-15]